MGKDKLSQIISLIIFIVIIAAAVWIFWPLLLILAVYIGFKVFQYRRVLKKTEETLREEPIRTYQDQLFTEEISRARRDAEEAEVIDVEFTRKEDAASEEGKRV